jgi:hypothetical protein
MRSLFVIAAAFALAACGRRVEVAGGPADAARRDAIRSADQLFAAMHDRYDDSWYRTLTFVQTSTYLRPDGSTSRTETWYEAAAIPGRLRIDLGDPSRGNGALYRNDSLYSVQGGRVVDRRQARNPLAILGFDVYRQSPARTMEQLRAEGFDLSVLHVDSLNGKRAYVVGAGPTDSTSNQFWVEGDRLLFVRLIQTDPQRNRTQDIRFERYVQHGGGWVAEEVRFLMGGRMFFHEAYSNVRVNVALPDDLFLPERWSTAPHWYKP